VLIGTHILTFVILSFATNLRPLFFVHLQFNMSFLCILGILCSFIDIIGCLLVFARCDIIFLVSLLF